MSFNQICKDLLDHILFTQLANRTLDSFSLVIYPCAMDTIVIWGGTLALFLNKLWRSLFMAEKIAFSAEEQFKRVGVYYMCIDDLPL